jgi:hypothetical protein
MIIWSTEVIVFASLERHGKKLIRSIFNLPPIVELKPERK